MSDGILIVLVSLAAGVVGTGLGGLLGAFLGGGSEKTVASVSGFAAGEAGDHSLTKAIIGEEFSNQLIR